MKKRRMFWDIVDKIKADIDSGIHEAGSRLPPERELAENFDVSRPTIREAIIALEAMGYVEVKTSSGVYVIAQSNNNNTPSEENLITAFELTQARALVEGEAAALAANSITDSELDKLSQTLDRMESGIEADKADREVHEIISKATRNNAILLSVKKYWELRDSQEQIKSAYNGVCSQSIQDRMIEHRAIYDALKEHNAHAARTAMHAHFNRLINALFDISEAQALEEVRKKTSQSRDLYSLNHLVG